VASAVSKPDGLLVVPPEEELTFLHPLPVERLWGVGAVTATKLHARGIKTVAEVAALPEAALVSMLGRASGRHLHALAHNRDPRPVEVGRHRRSIGSQSAFGRRRRTPRARLDRGRHRRPVTRRMRGGPGRPHRGSLRFDDCTRHPPHTLPGDGETDRPAHRASADGRQHAADRTLGLTLVGVAVSNLGRSDAVQLTLPFDRWAGGALDAAVDDVRTKYGTKALTRAVLLGRDHEHSPFDVG
jgi:DNA polymerase-4